LGSKKLRVNLVRKPCYLRFVPGVRLTGTVNKVLAALMRAGVDGAYGHEIARDSAVSKTTIYDVLARIENERWATSGWESVDPRAKKRPRRRIYRLTPQGQEVACKAIERELRALTGARDVAPWLPRPGDLTS